MAMLPVALVQARAVPLDVGRGIERATDAAAAAVAKGARLVGFGETLLGGYPIWLDEAPGAALWDHPGTQALHRILLEQAVVEGDPRFAAMQALADDNDAVICIGAHQRVRSSLYNSQWIFRKDARPLVRRKLVPTHGERLVWMRGDGSTLGVHRAGFGKVSTLMCWEHWMPLARAAMHAQGSAVHVAAWPTVRDAYLIASQHYAFEGRAFVLAAGTVMHRQDLMDGLAGVGGHNDAKALFDTIPDGPLQHGASAIIAPDTSFVGERAGAEETTLFADLDLDMREHALASLDTDGHYSRPDVFELSVNTRATPGVRFSADEARGELDVNGPAELADRP